MNESSQLTPCGLVCGRTVVDVGIVMSKILVFSQSSYFAGCDPAIRLAVRTCPLSMNRTPIITYPDGPLLKPSGLFYCHHGVDSQFLGPESSGTMVVLIINGALTFTQCRRDRQRL